jgi:hypothetical protein
MTPDEAAPLAEFTPSRSLRPTPRGGSMRSGTRRPRRGEWKPMEGEDVCGAAMPANVTDSPAEQRLEVGCSGQTATALRTVLARGCRWPSGLLNLGSRVAANEGGDSPVQRARWPLRGRPGSDRDARRRGGPRVRLGTGASARGIHWGVPGRFANRHLREGEHRTGSALWGLTNPDGDLRVVRNTGRTRAVTAGRPWPR